MKKKSLKLFACILALLCVLSFTACSSDLPEEEPQDTAGVTEEVQEEPAEEEIPEGETFKEEKKENPKGKDTVKKRRTVKISDIPAFEGRPFVVINDNVPSFPKSDMNEEAFETYSDHDRLDRCGPAYANVGLELFPTEERGSIGSVKPVGWHTVKYDHVDGKYLYNRCHLIGFQLTAENANRNNLITGTRYFNVEGMLPFENMIADYIRETKNHVLYRVTPVYKGDELLARGVQMEAYSVEDHGEGISFNVFAYNVQPGVIIDYKTGESRQKGGTTESDLVADDGAIRGNKNSKIYHCPGQRDYDKMADSKNLVLFENEKDAKNAGYRKAKQ